MTIHSAYYLGTQQSRMPFSSSFFPSSVVAVELVDGYCTMAQRLITKSVRQYEEFLRVPHESRTDPMEWKLLRRKQDLSLYKQRRSKDTLPYQLLQTLTDEEPIYTKNPVSMMMITGQTVGDLHDACHGAFIDSTESLRMRAKYTGEDVLDCQVLQQLRGPDIQDPFHFTGIIWVVLGGGLLPLIRRRDVVFLHSVGLTKLSNGDSVGYSLYHCVKLPSVPPLDHFKLVRMVGSYCFLKRQLGSDRIEVFMKGWLTPLGEMTDLTRMPSVLNSLLSAQDTVSISHIRKLLAYIRKCQSHESYKRASEIVACSTECSGGCTTNESRFGGKYGSCIACRKPVCAICIYEKKVIVEVKEQGTVSRWLRCCLPCFHHVCSMDAYGFASEKLRDRSLNVSEITATTVDTVGTHSLLDSEVSISSSSISMDNLLLR